MLDDTNHVSRWRASVRLQPAGLYQDFTYEKEQVAAQNLSYRKPIIGAILAIILFTSSLIYLCVTAPLSSAILVSGTLVVEASRQVIQHQDGGVVQYVPINEGDRVSIGQLMLKFDDQKILQDIESAKMSLVMNAASLSRLVAEQIDASTIAFPKFIDGIELAQYQKILNREINFFKARGQALKSRVQEAENVRLQAEQEMLPLQQQLAAAHVRLVEISKEFQGVRTLAEEGHASRWRLGQAASSEAAAQSDVAFATSHIIENEARKIKSKTDVEQVKSQKNEQVAQDILQAEREQLDIRKRLISLLEQERRVEIRAPISGHVIDLFVHSPGTIVNSGITIAEIVPEEAPMFVEAQLKPSDIVGIAVGSTIRCRIKGKDDKLQYLSAVITLLSADRLVDRQKGTPYFSLKAKLILKNTNQFQGQFHTGMPLEMMIDTGSATIGERLASPLLTLFESNPDIP